MRSARIAIGAIPPRAPIDPRPVPDLAFKQAVCERDSSHFNLNRFQPQQGLTMTTTKLSGKKVAIIARDGFEFSELKQPLDALRDAGAEAHVITPGGRDIRGWQNGDWHETVKADRSLEDADPADYDALLIPGGTINCDKLRMNQDAIQFVRMFFIDAKPVAAICHGPQLLIECGVLQGRRMTSYAAIKTDLKNAGAHWVDDEVVTDQGLTTSRSPADLDAFIARMLKEFAAGVPAEQRTA